MAVTTAQTHSGASTQETAQARVAIDAQIAGIRQPVVPSAASTTRRRTSRGERCHIRVTFKATGDFDDDQFAELTRLANYSPVRDTVSNPVPVVIEVARA